MGSLLYRVQDRSGRGPWRPGFSQMWSDLHGEALPPTCFEDFPNFGEIVERIAAKGLHAGCCVRGIEGLARWFTPSERMRLMTLGFYVANATQGTVVVESEHQAVVAFRKPMKHLPKVEWPDPVREDA